MTSGFSEEQKTIREVFLRGQEQKLLSESESDFLLHIFNQLRWKKPEELSVTQLSELGRIFCKVLK